MSTTLGGLNRDDLVSTPDVMRTIMAEADIAIPVGSMCAIDVGNSTDGKLLVDVAAANEDFCCIGVYTGVGGTGSATSTSGLTGHDAVDGDQVEICVYGAINALTDGSSAALVDRDSLQVAASGKLITGITEDTAGVLNRWLCLEASSADGASRVFIFA